MKRFFPLMILLILCMLLPSTSLAYRWVTPSEPENPELQTRLWEYMMNDLAPYLAKRPQEKWSAAYCHQIADRMEAAGFIIPEAYKDELYRTKKDHRLEGSSALAILAESQLGTYEKYTLYDKMMQIQVAVAAGTLPPETFDATQAVPPDSDPDQEELLSQFTQLLLAAGYRQEALEQYDVDVSYYQLEAKSFWKFVLRESNSYHSLFVADYANGDWEIY